jgi:hypothetical protein
MTDMNTRDVRMLEKCLRRPEWNIPPDIYDKAPAALEKIAFDVDKDGKPTHKLRARLSAIRQLAQFHAQNLAATPATQTVNVEHSGGVQLDLSAVASLQDDQLQALLGQFASALGQSNKPAE